MPPFKVYKVMQDINQQLYENKSTPEGFIPVYGVVITVPTGIYTNGQKEFTCDKTFDEVKEILLKGGSIIAVDNDNNRVNFDRIIISNNSIDASIIYFSSGGINEIDLIWDKDVTRAGERGTKSINTFVAINSNQITELKNNVYTKEEINNKFNDVPTVENTYTKAEVDKAIADAIKALIPDGYELVIKKKTT